MKEKKDKKSFVKSFFTAILDLAIALSVIATFALGYKYSIEIHASNYATGATLDEIEEILSTPIPREDLTNEVGQGLYKIKIDKYSDWMPVVEGEDLFDLSRGIGHNAVTGHPGDRRQIFLSAHNTTHFKVLENVNPGDTVTIMTPYGKFEYIISHTDIVNETQTDIIKTGHLEQDELLLMTCYPFTNWAEAEERFLVYAYPK